MKDSVSIGDASRMTGLSPKQIRTFEERGYIIPALRIISGTLKYRRFCKEHIDNLKALKQFIDEGFTLRAAAEKAKQQIKPGGDDDAETR
tara:strand:- start:667 stop:936 length:270 start_codon:yes stop_codon:yes gene_type:complete